jgi:uncharacterized protein YjlB
MPVAETLKKIAEKATGWARPSRRQLEGLVRSRKPRIFRFKDDGVIPNHPYWPTLVYRGAVRFGDDFDPAAVFEDLFKHNGWGNSWRNSIYDYVHYHSRVHEVLGFARGRGKVQFGGRNGRALEIKPGDVAILPAGTGHRCLAASEDFLVVGAYPPNGTYDECTTTEDRDNALKAIPKVSRPPKDPVYGRDGPLLKLWRPSR